jgi:hypothetical protein
VISSCNKIMTQEIQTSAHPQIGFGHWWVSNSEMRYFCKIKKINELRGDVR